MQDIAVIGAGPAGMTAGIYAARYGLSVTVIEKKFAGGQIVFTNKMENYPGFPNGVSGGEFAELVKKQAQSFGVAFQTGKAIDFLCKGDHYEVLLEDGSVEARSVILAVGAYPRLLGVKKEQQLVGNGVSYCATCDGAFFRGRDVCVIGGGNTALEDALFLSNIAKTVYLVHRRDEFRADQWLVNKVKQRENILCKLNMVVIELMGEFALEAVRLQNKLNESTEKITVDGCFVAIGQEPETAWLAGKIEMENAYILTDEAMATNIEGVFAAGDARKKPLSQVVTAAADGAIAAKSADLYLQSTP